MELTPRYPTTPVFNTLPKIHMPTRPPPGRPIISSYGCPTERISDYVDYTLQPFSARAESASVRQRRKQPIPSTPNREEGAVMEGYKVAMAAGSSYCRQ
ncbi:hypothetical protein J6590_082847 [Homalodisca vitripennis]|nr:hypothetical protein J6590_082847 [Homalodisca vitripennis]